MRHPKTAEPDLEFSNSHFVCDECGYEIFVFAPVPDGRRTCLDCQFLALYPAPAPEPVEADHG